MVEVDRFVIEAERFVIEAERFVIEVDRFVVEADQFVDGGMEGETKRKGGSMKMEKNALDLAGVLVRKLTEAEKKKLRRARDGYEEQVEAVLVDLLKTKTTLNVPSVDLNATLQEVKEAKQLLEAMAWLEGKLDEVQDTLRWRQNNLKKDMDLLSDVARPLATQDQGLATIFANYWDFSSEPAKKAAQTRRKKKE